MKHLSIAVANNLYLCLRQCVLHKHKVYHEPFHEFCNTVVTLERELGDQAEDEYWQELLREVKYYRFLLNAAPLPLYTQCDKLLSSLEKKLKICYYSFPNFSLQVQNLVANLTIMSNLPDNPILESLLKLVSSQDHHSTALLLKESYLFPFVEAILTSHSMLQHIKLVNQYQLRDATCYQQLLVIGPSYWYPEYIFRSPRAKEVHIIRYSWLADTWSNRPIFIKPFSQQQLSSSDVELTSDSNIRDHNTAEVIAEFEQNGQDILPEINWNYVSTKILKQTPDETDQEYIQTKLYLLANSQAVFLDANEKAKVLVIDLEAEQNDEDEDEDEEQHQVKRITLSKIVSGMFLLLRTEGGGDYIIPIANRILREKATILRAKQDHWKLLLRQAVEAKGIFTVSVELLYLGSELAQEQNVRNWMSNRSIHPQNDKDFRAIMRLIGLQDKEQEYQDAAKQIESAHRKAGFYIRKQLLKQVANADLRELNRKGYLEFELGETDSGSLTAFRIESIAPGIFNVPISRIGHPTIVQDWLWNG